MIELVYYSQANANLSSEDVSIILKNSRQFNSENNITGCLLYYNNEFLQILEGEKKNVLDLFAVIKKDKRHSNVLVLGEDKKDKRIFSDWHMAFHKFDSHAEEENHFRSNIVAFSEMADKPTHVIDLFWTMAKHMAIN
jgi:hypothetical protein